MKWSVLVVACVALAFAAQAQDVHSVNVGAVKSLTLPGDAASAKFYVLGINFDAFTPAEETLKDILGDQLTGADFPWACDQVWLWDAVNKQYEYYGLHTDGSFHDASDYPEPWNSTVLNPTITPGDAMWVITGVGHENTTITLTGQAVANDPVVVKITNDFNFVSYPLSADVALTPASFAGGQISDFPWSSDQIWIWDPDTDTYVYYGMHTDGDWHDASDYPEPWNSTSVGALNVNIGDGFWYVHLGSGFDWTSANPYKDNL